MGNNDKPKPKRTFCLQIFLHDETEGTPLVGRVRTDGAVPHNQIAIGGIQWCDFTTSHFNVNVEVPGYEPDWKPITSDKSQILDFRLKAIPPVPIIEPWNILTKGEVLNMKGNFGGFYIPGLPYHPTHLCYTSPYLSYTEQWRKVIREAHQLRKLTHMVVDLNNGTTYNNMWPSRNLSVEERIEAIKTLYLDGIIPVPNILNDEDKAVLPDMKLLLPYIRVGFVKWEMNEPDKDDTFQMASEIVDVMNNVREDALIFIHMGPDHGAPLGPKDFYYNPDKPRVISSTPVNGWNIISGARGNGPMWSWCARVGIAGIFAQCPPELDYKADTDYYNTFTRRFGLGLGSYPKGLAVIDFEHSVKKAFDASWKNHDPIFTEEECVAYSRSLREYQYEGKKLDGYMNG